MLQIVGGKAIPDSDPPNCPLAHLIPDGNECRGDASFISDSSGKRWLSIVRATCRPLALSLLTPWE